MFHNLIGAFRRKAVYKYEIAEELGLLPKLKQVGWAGLSTAESGRIGGLVGARLRKRGDPSPARP